MKKPEIGRERMYEDLAWLFPIITPPEDYDVEAAQFIQAIRQHARIPAHTLLDLGCGAGHNDHFLQADFQVTGIDLSEPMLALARKLNPDIEYLPGDMRTLRLGRLFDAVMVADSINYLCNEEDLRAVFQTAFAHLRPGGVFCTYSEEIPENFVQNGTYTTAHKQDDLEIALVENYYDPDPTDTQFEMTFIYLIHQGGELRIESDLHLAGLFPVATWLRLLAEAGFEVTQKVFEGEAFPFYIGVKPLDQLALG
jgi:SAM-dependent methyltransferase